jgi:hypothetical protein
MSNYVRDIEEQNEDLRRRLAIAEAKAVECDTYIKVIKRVLANSGFAECPVRDGVKFIAINSGDTLISSRDIGEDCMRALESILNEIKEDKNTANENLLAEIGTSFGKMNIDTRQ